MVAAKRLALAAAACSVQLEKDEPASMVACTKWHSIWTLLTNSERTLDQGSSKWDSIDRASLF